MPKRKQQIKINLNILKDQSLITLLEMIHSNVQFIYNGHITWSIRDKFHLCFPKNLKITNDLYIIGRKDIFELPKNLIVKGTLVITDTTITTLSNVKSVNIVYSGKLPELSKIRYKNSFLLNGYYMPLRNK